MSDSVPNPVNIRCHLPVIFYAGNSQYYFLEENPPINFVMNFEKLVFILKVLNCKQNLELINKDKIDKTLAGNP